MAFNVAIDGPAGAGKSTVAKILAGRLGYIYVDTGAMYRAMAFHFLRLGIDGGDEDAVSSAAAEANVTIRYEGGAQQVFLNGENVTAHIRSEDVGNMASATSVYPAVRKKLVALQQELARENNVVMDGRDIGTCVLPDAQVKIYLTASVQTRARRRYDELSAKGEPADLARIAGDIKERDYRDMHREASPLRRADDALLIDSSDMGIEEVVASVMSIIKERG